MEKCVNERKSTPKPPYLRLWTVLLCMLCVFSTVSANVLAEKTVTIKRDNISVKEALNMVKKQTGINIMYEDATLNNVPMKLAIEKAPLEQALSVICSKAGMRYELVENNYVLILPMDRARNRRTITGTVRDELGDPIIGASVVIKGTTFGTIADVDGQFMLSYPESAGKELMVSFIGMSTAEVKIEGKRVFNIKLRSMMTNLDEVVVIGYGTSKVKDLTGSVARVSQKEIEMAPMTSNISGMLQGKAAGVNVMISSASPTSPVSVVIRGQSSISGNNQPLWIIDGVPQYNSGLSGDVSNVLYNLNLNDVESIDVLKDASATAIYGSRAAAGVIIVTTKSGAEGMRPTIEFSARTGWQKLNSNDFKSMNAAEYVDFSKRMNLDEAFLYGGISYFCKRYMDINKFNTWNTSQWDKQDLDQLWLDNAYYDGTDDYWNLMTQNALAQDYNLSIRGGSKATSYYASVNYKDQDGIVKGSNSRYLGARFNFETKVRDKVKFGMNMDASTRTASNKDNMISKIIGIRPDYPAYNEDGTINTIDYYTKNPLVELKDKNKSDSKNFNASLFLEYDILPFLKFRSTANTTFSDVTSDVFYRTSYTGDVNSGSRRNTQSYAVVWDNLLTFYKTMGRHDVQAMLGHSMERESSRYIYAAGSDFPDDDILTNLGSAAVKDEIDSDKYASALASAFARVQYKYHDRYLLTGTFRMDGSSRFGKDKRWGYFPSAALGWIMTEEEFMANLKPYVSYLKLRASFGLTGSQNLDRNDYESYMGSNYYYSNPGIVPSSMGNSTLQWEAQRQTDVGLDYGFWNDRIRGSIGWYKKYVDNLINYKPVPLSSSFDEVRQNIGAISNQGIEFDIKVDIIKQRDLTWEVNFNAAHNKGKLEKLNGVTKFLGGEQNSTYKLEEGSELGTFYGYVDAGRLFMNAEEVWGIKAINPATGVIYDYYRDSSWARETAGDVYVLDLDGDGLITAEGDRKILGSSTPKVFGGAGTTLYWKGLMANLTFTYSIGGKRYWNMEASKCGGINVYNAPTHMKDSWLYKEGMEAKYPRTSHYGLGSNNVFTERWLHNASYLRLSALNLSYKLPEKWFRSWLIQGVEASFQATNLFTITPYPGMDPQGNFSTSSYNSALYGMGTDNSTYPAARTFNFGLKFTIK